MSQIFGANIFLNFTILFILLHLLFYTLQYFIVILLLGEQRVPYHFVNSEELSLHFLNYE